eukprot:GSChrysophyteH2.ASY1.ANO1.531.1 assembled CDS
MRETFKIDRRWEASLFNRWASPICQTGSGTNQAITVQGGLDGTGQTIGVADTGLDMSSCYFKDPINGPPKFTATCDLTQRKVIQYVTFGDNTDDGGGHGTHCAGTVAGESIIPYGDFVKYNGVSSKAKLSFFDIGTTANGEGSITLPGNLYTDLFAAQYGSGARIFSNSWGSPTSTYTVDCANTDEFMYDHQDALIIFAAGNDGDLDNAESTVSSPAGAKNVLTVGASLNSNDAFLAFANTVPDGVTDVFGPNTLAYFSSQGPTTSISGLANPPPARTKPDVVAPGWWVSSAAAVSGATYESDGHCNLHTLQGTSMSTPAVAGIAGLIRQYFIDGFYPSGSRNAIDTMIPMGALVKALFAHSGQQIDTIVRVSPTTGATNQATINSDYPNNVAGYGRVQIDTILNFGSVSTNSPLSLYVIGDYDNMDMHECTGASTK